jgi:hypothetical protein
MLVQGCYVYDIEYVTEIDVNLKNGAPFIWQKVLNLAVSVTHYGSAHPYMNTNSSFY